ncbi:MAG TPA: hypothetical protein VM689_18545 [Aliidongia sp.]|nr:hypothetical protein [Aliidongia sp.]
MLPKFLSGLLAVAFGLVLISPGHASNLIGDTKRPFNADRTVVSNGKSYSGRIYAEPGKQRHEQNVNGIDMVAILRADREVAWLVLPGLHIYTEFPFPKAVAEFDDPKLLGPVIGTDTVSGLKSVEHRIERQGSDGSALDGWLWMSEDGIVTKLDGNYTSPRGKMTPGSLALSNIHLGPQDPALFELPPGAKLLPYESLEPLLNMRLPTKH